MTTRFKCCAVATLRDARVAAYAPAPPIWGARGAFERWSYLVLPNREWDAFELVLLVDTGTVTQQANNAALTIPCFSFDVRALQLHHQWALEMMEAHGVSVIEVGPACAAHIWLCPAGNVVSHPTFVSRHYLEQRAANDSDGIGTTWAALLDETAAITAVALTDNLQLHQILKELVFALVTSALRPYIL